MWLTQIRKYLERFFVKTDSIQSDLSERWRPNANRRTLVILGVVGTLAISAYVFFIRPPSTFPVGALVSIPEGSTLSDAAKVLSESDVVQSPLLLRLLVTALGHQRSIHAG